MSIAKWQHPCEAFSEFYHERAEMAPASVRENLECRARLFNLMASGTASKGELLYRVLSPLTAWPVALACVAEASGPGEMFLDLPRGTATTGDGGAFFYFQIVGEMVQPWPNYLDKIARAKRISMLVDSYGGDGRIAIELFDALRGKEVRATVVNVAGSAATIPLFAASHVQMVEGACLVFHRPNGSVFGDQDKFDTGRRALAKLESRLFDIYSKRVGPDRAREWLMPDQETYLDAKQALELGLAHEIIPAPPRPPLPGLPVSEDDPLDPDGDAAALAGELLLRLRSAFKNKNRFAEVLQSFGAPVVVVSSTKPNDENHLLPCGVSAVWKSL